MVISTQNISKKYTNATALSDFSISIEQGDIYGLIGPNGAGKSTFIKVVTGLTVPTEGKITLFDSEDLDEARKQIGSIIETPSFFKNLTAYQNLTYYAKQFNRDDNVVEECLTKVGLYEIKDTKKFREYSLGMKQRLGIALALMNSPKLVILDEPTNGLDPVGISELREIIKELNNNGVTFIICSHILSELSQIATKFGVINNGKFVKEFTKDELQEMATDKTTIISSDFTKLKEFLEKEKIDYVATANNSLEISTKSKTVNDMVKALVAQGISVDGIYQATATLEDIFLQILNNKEDKVNV